ncbi:MAG TPA: CHAD domain-containing protein [Solirubrobacterales bacterium]|nr:CHAD domain-containing protein [Solirubrobacterales bacterium]
MKRRAPKKLDPQKPFRRNAARAVGLRLEELRRLARGALEPGDSAAQHEMRIAAKRLRYALEISGPCLGDGAGAAREVAAQLQSVLGELHDCDVLAPKAEGVESLTAFLRTRREMLFARFRELWGDDATQGALDALEHSL